MRKQTNWLLLAGLAALSACATPDLRAREIYQALGHTPGWLLTIDDARLKFATSSPQTLVEAPRPFSEATSLGRRYAAGTLSVDVTQQPCTDEKSGIAFSDTVVVLSAGYSYRGCGGKRVPLLDTSRP